MRLSLLLILFFSIQSFADTKKTCTINDGAIANEFYTLKIYNDNSLADFTDSAGNKMSCKAIDKDTINLYLKNYKNSVPATDHDLIFYCFGSGTFSISVINEQNEGQFYISKYAFNINCN